MRIYIVYIYIYTYLYIIYIINIYINYLPQALTGSYLCAEHTCIFYQDKNVDKYREKFEANSFHFRYSMNGL